MRKLSFYAILFTIAIYSNAISQSQDIGAKLKRYNIRKACIEYNISSPIQKGIETLYFDNYGTQTAKYTKLNIPGLNQETNMAAFTEGTWIYTVDLDKKTGTKMEDPLLKSLEDQNLQDVGKQMMVKMGGKKVGSEKFLGKICEIWQNKNLGSKSWIWNWIPLKTEIDMGGMKMSYTATKITFSFDRKKLDRPKNIKYQRVENMLKKLEDIKKSYQKN